jgi:hypothetical protein
LVVCLALQPDDIVDWLSLVSLPWKIIFSDLILREELTFVDKWFSVRVGLLRSDYQRGVQGVLGPCCLLFFVEIGL